MVPNRQDNNHPEHHSPVIVTIDGQQYDLTDFARHHQGGEEVIRHLNGKDISVLIRQVHSHDEKVWRILNFCKVDSSQPAQEQRCPVDKAWFYLQNNLKSKGLFNLSLFDVFFHYLLPISLFWLGVIYFLHSQPLLAGLLATLGSLKSVHFMHDLGHQAVFETGEGNRWATRWLGILLLGMDTRVFGSNHMIHHSFTNVVGEDEALENGPIKFHPDQGSPTPYQQFIWLFIMGMTGPYFWLGQFARLVPDFLYKYLPLPYGNWRKGTATQQAVLLTWHESAFALLRLAIMIYFLGFWLTIIPVVIAISFTAYIATLNHFHLPILTAKQEALSGKSFVECQAEVTQNWYWYPRWFWTWLSGGLDLHLAHHLFPTLPSFRLRRADREIRKFCEQFNLPYYEVTLLNAMRSAFYKTTDPNNDIFIEKANRFTQSS